MDVSDWKALLNESVMFSRLTEEEVDRLLEVSERKSFTQGNIIIKEGDPGENVYFIGTGVVTITLSGANDNKLPIDTLGPGNFFGEMACIEHKPRMATVVVENDCELLIISSIFFHELVEENARFASKFSLILSERLRKLTEEVLAVRVKNVDEKLELSNTKLDASLKAMESQMKASETIFEQTSIRASEVIHSFDRTRTQVILAGSVVSIIASLILGVLAFLGWKEWKNITEPVQLMAVEFKSEVDKAKSNILKIEKTAGEIDSLNEMIQTQSENAVKVKSLVDELNVSLEDSRRSQHMLYSIILRTQFDRIVQDQREDLYAEMLNAADAKLTEDLFIQFPKGLIRFDQVYRQLYINLLRAGLNKDYVKTPKQEALSYYYLMAAYLLENNEQEYIATRVRFDRFMNKQKSQIYILQDLGPSWFEEYMSIMKEDEQNSLKIARLNEVWDQITRRKP